MSFQKVINLCLTFFVTTASLTSIAINSGLLLIVAFLATTLKEKMFSKSLTIIVPQLSYNKKVVKLNKSSLKAYKKKKIFLKQF